MMFSPGFWLAAVIASRSEQSELQTPSLVSAALLGMKTAAWREAGKISASNSAGVRRRTDRDMIDAPSRKLLRFLRGRSGLARGFFVASKPLCCRVPTVSTQGRRGVSRDLEIDSTPVRPAGRPDSGA